MIDSLFVKAPAKSGDSLGLVVVDFDQLQIDIFQITGGEVPDAFSAHRESQPGEGSMLFVTIQVAGF